LQANNPHSQEF